mmetsp:Transcript_6471/g.13858  ORF Transcript_6471/g.13858 Transcript_6471/m.13858 type:complete len:126 (+) Transcript_6471:53-430(+)
MEAECAGRSVGAFGGVLFRCVEASEGGIDGTLIRDPNWHSPCSPFSTNALYSGKNSAAWMKYLAGSCRAVLRCKLLSQHGSRMCWEASRCFWGVLFRCVEAREGCIDWSLTRDPSWHSAGSPFLH